MRAILTNKDGFVKEMQVPSPPQQVIRMAVSDLVTPMMYHQSEDLSVLPSQSYSEIRFLLRKIFKNPLDTEDVAIYAEEGTTAISYDEVVKKTLDKLRGKIVEAVETSSPMYASLHTAKAQLAQLEEKAKHDLWVKQAIDVAEKHKATFGYDSLMEASMVAMGPLFPPLANEEPFDWLTRLLHLAKKKAEGDKMWKSKTYTASSVAETAQYLESLKAQQKMYNQQVMQAAQMQQQMQPIWQTSAPPWQYDQYTNSAGMQMQPGAIIAAPEVPPKIEKVEKELPEPIEPKKRLMKKR